VQAHSCLQTSTTISPSLIPPEHTKPVSESSVNMLELSQKPSRLDFTEISFLSSSDINQRVDNYGFLFPIESDNCSEEFLSPYTYQRFNDHHRPSENDNTPKSVVCDICQCVFTHPADLKRHHVVVHSPLFMDCPMYECTRKDHIDRTCPPIPSY